MKIDIIEKFKRHLEDKAPEFPHIWQISQRIAVKKEIESECEFLKELLKDMPENKTSKDVEAETQLQQLCGIVNGILKHFDLEVRKKYEPDPAYAPPTMPSVKMREVYEVYPYKKS
jgi:hypothetical protein